MMAPTDSVHSAAASWRFTAPAGQTSMHSSQPVQSSGATCSVYFCSLNSFQRAGADLKVAGAFFKRSGE